MPYSEQLIDEIRERADLVKIISNYVHLKRRGSSWVGLCPFHKEKTPSFSVSPERGIYKCFGCGKAGNVFNFLMEIEGLSFFEALQKVAEIEGFELPKKTRFSDEENKKLEAEKKLKSEIIRMNQLALEFWEALLSEKEGRIAQEYLKSRGILEPVRKQFRLGYAPDNRTALYSYLRSKGYTEDLIRESGLFFVSDDGIFDRFRHRLIFPIFDVDGNPIGFGGRVLDGKQEPKYLNSPETAVYVKSRHLYGLFQTKEEIRRQKVCILVEGYMDLISLYQAGVKPVVASLGTAFSDEQARLLKRFASKAIINYDGDSAGIKAAKKALETLLSKEFEVKVLILPDGADPDDFVRRNNAKKYKELLRTAYSCEDFLIREVAKTKSLKEGLEECLSIIKAIPDRIKKREIFDKVSFHFNITDPLYREELWKQVRTKKEDHSDAGLKEKIEKYLESRLTIAEKRLLELLYHSEKVRSFVFPKIEKEDYNNLLTAPVFEAFLKLYDENKDFSLDNLAELISKNDWCWDILVEIHLSSLDSDESEHDLIDEAKRCLLKLRSMVIEKKILENSRLLMIAEQEGDKEKIEVLVREQIALNKLRAEMEKPLSG